MPDEDPPRPRKRRRPAQKFNTSSIYLAPRSSSPFPFESLGASLASRSGVQSDQDQVRDQNENQIQAQRNHNRNQNQEDEQGPQSVYHDRTIEGWRSRRQREKARADYITTPDESGPRLPDDDLLTSLHLHAARVFEHNGLLIPRKRHARAEPWPSKKRQLIESKGSIRAVEGSRPEMEMKMGKKKNRIRGSRESGTETSGSGRSSTSRREGPDEDENQVDGEGEAEGEEGEGESNDGNQDEDEGEMEDVGNGKEDNIRNEDQDENEDEDKDEDGGEESNYNDENNEDEHDNDNENNDNENDDDNDNDKDEDEDETLRSQLTTASSERTRKKYKRRDMYRAFDGSALMALGILVEEFIIAQIHQAGYKRLSESDKIGRNRIHRHEPIQQLSDTENDSRAHDNNNDDNDNRDSSDHSDD